MLRATNGEHLFMQIKCKKLFYCYNCITFGTHSGAELPVTARGRISGSKRRKTEENSTEDKSGKVIRSVWAKY